MPTVTLDIEEQLTAALESYNAAEETYLAANGADAQKVADDAVTEAFNEVTRLQQAFARTEQGKQFEEAIRARNTDRISTTQVLSDGTTFDDLANQSGVVNPQPGMTLGEAFAASDAYKELRAQFLKSDGTLAEKIGRSRAVDFAVGLNDFLNGRNRFEFAEGARNTLITGASPTGGQVFVEPYKVPGISDLVPLRQGRVIDLCTRIPLTTDLMEWMQITAKTNNAAFVPEAISAAPIVAGVPTNADAGMKPESGITFGEASAKVENIAHWVPFTRRVAADAPQLITILNSFLFRGLDVKIEDGVMLGNGTSPNLRGLLNTTAPWNIQTFDISANGNPTRLDALALAAGAIFNAGEGEWAPNAVLIHPLDWFSTNFTLAKDAQGQYFGPGPWAAMGMQAPWGIRPIITKAVAQGVQVVGDFTQALVGDRQQNTLLFFDQHQDYAIRNLLLALAESRLAFGVRVPQAFVQIVA